MIALTVFLLLVWSHLLVSDLALNSLPKATWRLCDGAGTRMLASAQILNPAFLCVL